MAEQFWLSDAQWAAIEPLLPRLGGKPRADDRRIISGILHRYREGLRWRAIPAEYGPMAALTAVAEPPEIAMVDSTSVRAHRSARANEQSHAALLRGEDVLDPSPDARSRGVAARDVRRHRPSVGLRALELR